MFSSQLSRLFALKRIVQVASLIGLLGTASLAQVTQQKYTSPTTNGGDLFGWSLSRQAATLAVGAPTDDHSGKTAPGAVHMWAKTGSTWTETAEVRAFDAESFDNFGVAAHINGTRMIVGANFDDHPGVSNAGSAYVYELQNGAWTFLAKLIAPNGASNDQLGEAVAIDGDVAYVGAIGREAPGVVDAGSVYVFEYDPLINAWLYVSQISASAPQWQGYFGASIKLTPTGLLVGSYGADLGAGNAGAIYAIDGDSQSGFVQTQVIQASPPAANAEFGFRFSVEGTRMAVGAARLNGVGGAYVFEQVGGQWTQTASLAPFDPEGNSYFGNAVALSGDRVAVGAVFEDQPPSWDQGSVYLFEKSQWGWVETGKVVASDAAQSDQFGFNALLQGAELLVGVPFDDHALGGDAGSFYSLEVSKLSNTTPFGFCSPSVAPCNNADPTGGCKNVTTRGAFLIDSGTTSVSADDLVLSCTRLPPLGAGIIYMGGAAITYPFSSGVRVVASGAVGTYRYRIQSTGTTGAISEGPGIAAWSQSHYPLLGQIQAGQTWYFQAWYRDPQGPCGSSNFSNGVAVTFAP
jgi:hypothetical protein